MKERIDNSFFLVYFMYLKKKNKAFLWNLAGFFRSEKVHSTPGPDLSLLTSWVAEQRLQATPAFTINFRI